MRIVFLALAVFAFAEAAMAEVREQFVEYRDGDAVLEGFVAWDDSSPGPRPGVLIVHQWKGISDHERDVARRLARMGYTAFCADIYGKGVRPQSAQDSGAQAGKYKGDRALFRSRLRAAHEQLKGTEDTDPKRTAVIGYCFGGTGALELARSGADVRAAVSFHGGLDSPTPEDAKNIKGVVLVLHGGDDPGVPDSEVMALWKEMRDAKVDWRFVAYGGAVHAFTHKDANAPGRAMYHETADRESWQEMTRVLREVF